MQCVFCVEQVLFVFEVRIQILFFWLEKRNISGYMSRSGGWKDTADICKVALVYSTMGVSASIYEYNEMTQGFEHC